MTTTALKPMTMREMGHFTSRFQNILVVQDKRIKLERLQLLANDLKGAYQIIAPNDPVMSADQPELMKLYRMVLKEINQLKEEK